MTARSVGTVWAFGDAVSSAFYKKMALAIFPGCEFASKRLIYFLAHHRVGKHFSMEVVYDVCPACL